MLLLLSIALALPARAGVFPYEIASETLPNGLDVHVVPMPSEGVVAVYTWMSVGSRDEVEPGRTGFAHFFEHLMFHDTTNRTGEERERALLRMGADENAWTWFDETVYHGLLPVSALEGWLDLEADRFQHLALTPEGVRREAGAVYGEWRKSQADPDERLIDTLYATAFRTHTYGHSTIGLEEDIDAMPGGYEAALAFFQRHYRPENATILVVGDVEPGQVFTAVEERFGTWTVEPVTPHVLPEEPPQQGTRREEVAWSGPTAARLAMGWRIPGHDPDADDVAALQVADDLLLSRVGPLQRRLVEEEGLAYTVRGGRDSLVDPALFQVIVTLKDEAHLERAEAIVREEVDRLEQQLDPAEIERASSHARYAFLTSLDDPSNVADALGWHLRRGDTPDAIDRFYARYDAVTPEVLAAAAGRWLTDDRLTVVTLVPREEAE